MFRNFSQISVVFNAICAYNTGKPRLLRLDAKKFYKILATAAHNVSRLCLTWSTQIKAPQISQTFTSVHEYKSPSNAWMQITK